MMDLTGNIYHNWTVVKEAKRRGAFRYWICKCKCGSVHEVYQGALRRKHNPSTSCLKCRNTRAIHGMSKHPIYFVWQNMKRRCYDPNHEAYKYYGEAGVTVCDDWMKDPHIFIMWAEPIWFEGSCIDRINPYGNYEPSNCTFVNKMKSARNTRANYTKRKH